MQKDLGYETSDHISDNTSDEYFLAENTKECFVAQVKSFRFLERLVPALLEIAPYFFENNNDTDKNPKAPKEDWAYFWNAVWSGSEDYGGPCAWVSPKGNIIDCKFGLHQSICRRLFYLSEKDVEKIWLKISAHEYHTYIHEKYLTTPTKKQIKAGYAFIAQWEKRRA